MVSLLLVHSLVPMASQQDESVDAASRQENDVISTTSHQWGWVASPPGADLLGQGEYAGVKVSVSPPSKPTSCTPPHPQHQKRTCPSNRKPGHNLRLPRRLQRSRVQLQRRHRAFARRIRPPRPMAQSRRPRSFLGRHLHDPRLRCRLGHFQQCRAQGMDLAALWT